MNASVAWRDQLTTGSWSADGVSAPTVIPSDTAPSRIDLRATLPSGMDRQFIRLQFSN